MRKDKFTTCNGKKQEKNSLEGQFQINRTTLNSVSCIREAPEAVHVISTNSRQCTKVAETIQSKLFKAEQLVAYLPNGAQVSGQKWRRVTQLFAMARSFLDYVESRSGKWGCT